jgi:hypothetical protein
MTNNTTFNAELIASAITANCEAYFAKKMSRDVWSAKQTALWKQAADSLVASKVKELLCPSLHAPMPPYAVREQMRARTLKVGR